MGNFWSILKHEGLKKVFDEEEDESTSPGISVAAIFAYSHVPKNPITFQPKHHYTTMGQQ